MSAETFLRMVDGWTVRVRGGMGEGLRPTVVMLHGWTGDENVMWVFAPRLPAGHLILAPRGPYAAEAGGYAWHAPRAAGRPAVDDFLPAARAIEHILRPENFPGGDIRRVHLIGFSQGAALAYTFMLRYPARVASLAALAGFLPEGAEELAAAGSLPGIPVYISHGRNDPLVPVAQARRALAVLQEAGAAVEYCEEDVGHKLAVECFRGLGDFFAP